MQVINSKETCDIQGYCASVKTILIVQREERNSPAAVQSR